MIREEVTPRRRLSSEESRIPVPSSPILRRSGSVRLSSFSPIAEHARNGGTSKNSRTPPLNRHRSLQCLSTPASACLSSPDRDDDADSVQSFGSCSAASCASQCEHACFARNGTTYSGRQRRYVVHCSPHSEPGHEYLTPTQRANNTIRKLKQLLQDRQTELIDKEKEVFRLTKEVVELRLVKAASASIDATAAIENHNDERNGHNGVEQRGTKSIFNDVSTPPTTRKEAVNLIDQSNSPSAIDGIAPLPAAFSEVPASLVDSGHFEDLNGSCSIRDSPHSSPTVSLPAAAPPSSHLPPHTERLKQNHEDELRQLNEKYHAEVRLLKENLNDEIRQLREKLSDEIRQLKECHSEEIRQLKECHYNEIRQLEEIHGAELGKFKDNLYAELRQLNENHSAELSEIKERHNDKVDSLLQRITEANDRFCALRPKLEEAENRIKALEVENEELKRSHQETEEKHKTIYLEMYKKGHEAAKLESDMHQGNGDAVGNSVLTENEKLLKELNLTKKDLENVKANYRRLLETRQSVSKQDPEITLNFLKSAVYYFLTDRENSQRHLLAIESILGFTDNEKMNIEKAYLWR